MHKNNVLLRAIQEISGHRKLEQLQKYLEVDSDQIRGAIAMLSMISPVPTELIAEETTECGASPEVTQKDRERDGSDLIIRGKDSHLIIIQPQEELNIDV